MAERNWTACFLCQDLGNKEKVSYPASRINFTDENLRECFGEQMKYLIKFGDNELMPQGIDCNDMVNLGEKKAVDEMMARKKGICWHSSCRSKVHGDHSP